MNQTVQIQNQEIQVKEYKGQRVITFKDVDLVHGRPSGTASRTFRANRKHFVEGEDYFKIGSDEIRRMGIVTATYCPSSLIIITEGGYLLLVKSITDDRAWSVQRQLRYYFKKVREVGITITAAEKEGITTSELIRIGEVIASSPPLNLLAVLDVYRDFMSADVLWHYQLAGINKRPFFTLPSSCLAPKTE